MSAHARRRSLVTSALVEVRARDVLARLALARLAHLDQAAGQLQAWRRLLIAHSPRRRRRPLPELPAPARTVAAPVAVPGLASGLRQAIP